MEQDTRNVIDQINGAEVEGTPLNFEWFQGVMQRALKTDATLKSVRARRVDEGKGYLSFIASVHMEWQRGDSKTSIDSLLTRVIVKTPMVTKLDDVFESMQAAYGGDPSKVVTFAQMNEKMNTDGEQPFDASFSVHNNECLFYDILTNGRTTTPPVPIPTCYYHERHEPPTSMGVLLLEDLSERARVPEFADSLTLGQLRSLFIAIARLHAWCLKNPRWLQATNDRQLTRKEMDAFAPMQTAGIDFLQRAPITRDIVRVSDADARRLFDLDDVWEMYDPVKRKHHPPLLVHGDLWTHNLFFGYDPTGRSTDELIAIVDWQTARIGACYDDMVHLMTSSVDCELRREHEYELIDEYYSELERLLYGSTVRIPYGVDDVKRWYARALKFGVCEMITHLPLVLWSEASSGRTLTDAQKRNLAWRVQAGIEDTFTPKLPPELMIPLVIP